jgi:hypothetical protein
MQGGIMNGFVGMTNSCGGPATPRESQPFIQGVQGAAKLPVLIATLFNQQTHVWFLQRTAAIASGEQS